MQALANAKFMAMAPEIYGRYWKTNICRHLGYDYKTLRNWARGVNEPPTVLIVLLCVYTLIGWQYVREKNTVEKVRKHGKSAGKR